jgi:hypothetical protein
LGFDLQANDTTILYSPYKNLDDIQDQTLRSIWLTHKPINTPELYPKDPLEAPQPDQPVKKSASKPR